jgi:two-component system phosphate regulon sensor histidine kinase PhoR
VGYLTLDTSCRITKTNQAVNYILQGFEGGLIGERFARFVASDEEVNEEVLLEKIIAGVTVNEEEAPLLNGKEEIVWVLISAIPYRNTGERLVSLVDITEQKKVDTAKSEFVALATHQLRTPIAAIRWNVELLERSLRESKSDAQGRYLGKVDRNVHRMISLINDFLSVSKLEMGTYAAETVEINLSEFITSIIDEYDGKFSEKNINLDRHDNPPELVVQADRRLLHIALSNLVSNASKYTDSNGTITIRYEKQGGQVQFVVADDGIGIPESELDSLFNKFFRASNAEAHQTEGTGLGLYIVRESVHQMGGEITVSSVENEGTEFTILLPLKSNS